MPVFFSELWAVLPRDSKNGFSASLGPKLGDLQPYSNQLLLLLLFFVKEVDALRVRPTGCVKRQDGFKSSCRCGELAISELCSSRHGIPFPGHESQGFQGQLQREARCTPHVQHLLADWPCLFPMLACPCCLCLFSKSCHAPP